MRENECHAAGGYGILPIVMATKAHAVTKIGIFLDIPGLARIRAISGLYRFARQKPDWRIFQFHTQRNSKELQAIAASFRPDAIFAGHVDAVRAFCPNAGDTPVPYVLIENTEPTLPGERHATLSGDNIQVGYAAAEKLFGLGYRYFGYLGIVFNATTPENGQMLARTSKIRSAAFERRAHELGVEASVHLPKWDSHNFNEPELREWLRALPKPCGILAFSDEDAQYVISICHDMRIPVPKQIGVIGIDNEEYICENVTPALTSIEPDYEGAGYRAGELLDEFLSGDGTHAGAREQYGVATIHDRASAQNLTTSANRVTKALEIIRARHADPSFGPSEISHALDISPRLLQLAFSNHLGRSIVSEILQQRLATAKRLLRNSRQRVGEIARLSGFRSYPAFSASFHRITGVTPKEWRTAPVRANATRKRKAGK